MIIHKTSKAQEPEKIFVNVPVPGPERVEYKVIEKTQRVVPDLSLQANDLSQKSALFSGLMNNYNAQFQELYSKISQQARVKEYLRQEVDKASQAQSLEASIVQQSRYSEALVVYINLQQQLIISYASILPEAKKYIDYLEKSLASIIKPVMTAPVAGGR
ncbi:MAG: hypothetical protein MUF05_07245 [Candidatus Omnitrophica bacterium]|nr:hypothetical protein [Candidatus Omnitrophota bacterium]